MASTMLRHYFCASHVTIWLELTISSLITGTVLETGDHEYCPWEFFNATCPSGSLVVMNSAQYGRMRLGRCIDTDYQIGCGTDVLPQLDGRCSGRPSCYIHLPDQSLQHMQPCNRDLLAYLQASYSCIPIIDVDAKACLESGSIRLTQTEGYLASYLAQANGHGTSACPWVIQGRPGQRVKLLVLDFSAVSRYKPEPEPGEQKRALGYCHIYATVSEEKRSEKVDICSEKSQERLVYTSTTNTLTIELSDTVLADLSVSFIIRFMVFGCADPLPPRKSWMERSGDRITVRCNDSGQSWHLVCKDAVWIGQTAECQGVPYGDKVVDDSTFPSYGLAIAVIIGIFVGALCGFLLLALVLWCRRQTVPNSPRYGHNIELITTGQAGDHPEHICKVHHIPTGDYGYTHVWELRNTQLPMSTGPMSPNDRVDDSTDPYKSTEDPRLAETLMGRLEHSYECPIFDERLLLSRMHAFPPLHHHCTTAQHHQTRITTADQGSPVASAGEMARAPLGKDPHAREPRRSACSVTVEAGSVVEDAGQRDTEEELGTAKSSFNCPSSTLVGFSVDQDPTVAKIPMKIENHYL